METEENKKSQKKSPSQEESCQEGSCQEESCPFQVFIESFEREKRVEEKIALAIGYMKELLSQRGGGRLRDFFEVRKHLIPLFKEQISPVKRNHLWSEYVELLQEARRLKEMMDEEAAFAIEQIELAIEALEKEMEDYGALIAKWPKLSLPDSLKDFFSKHPLYDTVQRELNLLKMLISRLSALRGEVIQTDMRVGHKNRLLKRLSKLGDHIFPKQKALIKTLDAQFIQEIETFVRERFPQENLPEDPTDKETDRKKTVPYYVMREEIKSLQKLAKVLSLGTDAFTKTREMLSRCWDIIKEKDRERKKEVGEKNREYRDNFVKISEKVKAFRAFCKESEFLVRDQVMEKAHNILDEIKAICLSRVMVRTLHEEIQKVRRDGLDKIQEKATQKGKEETKQLEAFKEKMSTLIEKEGETALEQLLEEEQALVDEYSTFLPLQIDRYLFERQFLDIRSFILDKKENKADSKQELEILFDERLDLLEEVKTQIEIYRKEMGGSGLDFKKGMIYRELCDSAKIHLQKETEALDRLEQKLDRLEN